MRLVNLTAKGTANPFHGRDSPSTAEPYETDSGWGLVAVGKRAVQSDRHTRTSLTPLMSRKIHTLSQIAAFCSLRERIDEGMNELLVVSCGLNDGEIAAILTCQSGSSFL